MYSSRVKRKKVFRGSSDNYGRGGNYAGPDSGEQNTPDNGRERDLRNRDYESHNIAGSPRYGEDYDPQVYANRQSRVNRTGETQRRRPKSGPQARRSDSDPPSNTPPASQYDTGRRPEQPPEEKTPKEGLGPKTAEQLQYVSVTPVYKPKKRNNIRYRRFD